MRFVARCRHTGAHTAHVFASDEFKRHKDAAPKFVPLFVREWEQYEQFMRVKKDRVRLDGFAI